MAVKLIVHKFSVGDVDDPELYAAQPIWEWQQTDVGKWVMENAIEDPYWMKHLDQNMYSYQYAIVATLREEDATFFKLKYDNTNRT